MWIRWATVFLLVAACGDASVVEGVAPAPTTASEPVRLPSSTTGLRATTVPPTTVPPTTVPPTTVAPTPSSTTASTNAAAESPTTSSSTSSTTTNTTVPPTTVPAGPPPTPIHLESGERLRLVLTGDSITDQVSPYLRWILGRVADVERRHHGGTALCDWFADRGDDLGFENLEQWAPHVYVVDHGGNALTPCMADMDGAPLTGAAYEAKYLADSERLLEVAALTDSRVLFVDQPVGRGNHLSGTHFVFRSMPERHPGGHVRFLSTWPAVSPGGHFLQASPCEDIEPGCVDGMGELRSPFPGGHLEPLGAWRYARAIVNEFVAAGWVDAADVDVADRVMP